MSMEITDVTFNHYEKGKLLGFADIVFEKSFVVKGIRLWEGDKGLNIGMPSQKKDDEWFDIAYPITKELREDILDAVVDEYENGEKKDDRKSYGSKKRSSNYDDNEDSSRGRRSSGRSRSRR